MSRLGLAWVVGTLCLGCGGEAVVTEITADAGAKDAPATEAGPDADPDSVSPPDAPVDGQQTDAAIDCGGEMLQHGYVLGTTVEPTHPESDIDDFQIAGTVSYKGPVTEPLATMPLFDKEIRIAHDGTESTLQYYLPAGYDLPVEVGSPCELLYRRRHGFEGYAVGIVVTRPTSGLHPLLFVGDTGSYGRAFYGDEPLTHPLRVTTEEEPACPTEPDPACGGTIYRDMMVFDTSTGGAVTELRLAQGRAGTLPVFGTDFTMVNLASTRVEPGCPDDPRGMTSYLAVIED